MYEDHRVNQRSVTAPPPSLRIPPQQTHTLLGLHQLVEMSASTSTPNISIVFIFDYIDWPHLSFLYFYRLVTLHIHCGCSDKNPGLPLFLGQMVTRYLPASLQGQGGRVMALTKAMGTNTIFVTWATAIQSGPVFLCFFLSFTNNMQMGGQSQKMERNEVPERHMAS